MPTLWLGLLRVQQMCSVGECVRYPLDTVKVRMQSSSPVAPHGAMACLRHILRHEGVPGLFRGVTTPLVGGALESGVNYMVYCQVLQALTPSTCSGSGQRGVSSGELGGSGSSPQGPSWASPLPGASQPSPPPPQLVHVGLAGAAAGAALSLLLSPVELLKCRMQSAEYRQLGGPGAVLRDLLAAEGPRGLGRGLGATVMREVPGNALFFVVYEGLKRALHQPALTTPGSSDISPEWGPGPASSPGQQQQHSLWGSAVREAAAAVLCGGCAGSVMWAVVLPLDVAKTRLQVAVPGSAWDVGVVQHLGMVGCGPSLGIHCRTMDRVETLCTLHAPLLNSRGLTADCDGFALVCCVEEERVGWVVKRSKTGAGLAMLFSLDFEPNGFAVYGPSFWISHGKTIMEYSATGECLTSILGPANAAYMEFLGNTLYTIAYNNKWQAGLYGMDKMGRTSKLLANHVQLSGGFALFPAAQILLFTSTHNSLCQLDLQSGECRVITTSFWPKDARLLTGNDQLALLVVFRGGGNDFFSCSAKGELLQLWSMPHSAVNRDYRLNSRGDLLFIDQHDKELPRICCLPALLPPPEATTLRAMDRIDTLCTLHTPISSSRGMTADCDGFALVCCVYEEGFTTLFRLYFIAFLTGVLCAMDTTSGAIKVMANHVKSTGGMAVLPAAQKLLFISSRNSLCQLDLQSRECQVITPSVWPGGGRLLTGNDQLALLIVPCTGGSNFFSCSVQGELRHLRCVQHSAVSPDYRLNSRGDLLFFERRGKELARLSCLPALLPPAEATACKIGMRRVGMTKHALIVS
ncbi:hypothetical protein QJQ45_028470 [Haematococcus lacustris]|nr:hypothetical protein QJQ45_028470 [Haematococcus lacustris]